jgi:nitrogen fixation/metabolism regulation signal transduction histidine kinase
MRTRRHRLTFERRLFLLALCAGFPAVVCAIILLSINGYSAGTRWTVEALLVLCWLGFAAAVEERIGYAIRTLANLLSALAEGDFSFRLRQDDKGALGEVYEQINQMAGTLHEQRLGAMEAAALLQKVIGEIDVAIFAFDSQGILRLLNRSGERVLGRDATVAIGESADHLGLKDYLSGPFSLVTRAVFGGASGQWSIRRSDFRENGQPHQLLVLSDITRPLREEELHAWQRLVRVLGHEINNSLTPVKSLSSSLLTLVAQEPLPSDWREDVQSGLNVISGRCEALNRFTGAYARLARLPVPKMQPMRLAASIERVVRLETRLTVRLQPGPDVTIDADADQLDQLLINIIRNAADASLETGGSVYVCWRLRQTFVQVVVEDEGLGIANPGNLFVPFFTTKPGGSGIGLFLSRQIAEGHGGSVTLRNREKGRGCEAVISLPAA